MANCVFCNCELTGRRTKYCASEECQKKRSHQDNAKHYARHKEECRAKYDRWQKGHSERVRLRKARH